MFRLGLESSKALVPKDVRSSQYPNSNEPARQRIKSGRFIVSKILLIFSRTFIDIYFHKLENKACLYYISGIFSREIDYGYFSYRRAG